MPHHQHNNPEMAECIRDCLDCFTSCQQTAMTHCLQVGGRHTEPGHFRLMSDCAEICRAAATLMMNDSPFHHELCRLCADICDQCAKSCRDIGDMDDCVEACERCAASCRRMAAGGGQGARGRQPELRPQ
jgi:hypothetical protein